LEAKVHLGPDAGLSLSGDLILAADRTGTVIGQLVHTDGTIISITGQATGRALNLIFDLGERGLVFGVGTGQQPISACSGVIGGPLVGPRSGDSGDWAVTRQAGTAAGAFLPASFPADTASASDPAAGPIALPRVGTGTLADSRVTLEAALSASGLVVLLAIGLGVRLGRARLSPATPAYGQELGTVSRCRLEPHRRSRGVRH
jgi:hypothetical protein